jgi:hypothetical protein
VGALAAAASGCGPFLMCHFAVGLQSAPAKVPQSAIILHILEAATLLHAHATLNYCTDNTLLRHGLGQSQLEARAQGRGKAAGAQAPRSHALHKANTGALRQQQKAQAE